MKKKLSLIALSVFILFSHLSIWGQSLGTECQRLDDWLFSIDSLSWQNVRIPHSYNAIDGHSSHYYRGKAYYQRTLTLSGEGIQQPLLLLFEGAAQQATVVVNGKLAATHHGGYTPFWVNLNGFVHEGSNSITVTCDNHEDPDLIPVASDFNKNGGLHNPAWLLRMSPVYFSPNNTGLYRLHVSTPQVNDNEATASLFAEIINATGKRQKITVSIALVDQSGKTVAKHQKKYQLPQDNLKATVVNERLTVGHPHLWNGIKDPYLYQAIMTITDDNGRQLDEVKSKFGFRYFQATADKGFLLNGKSYSLRGVSEHQDMDGKASAVSDDDIHRDYQIIKELGCNFLRLAHYPHRDLEYALCDSLGIIVQTEIPWVNVCGVNAKSEYFDNIHSQMHEMITSLYNHPSIVFWGMWNELDAWGNKSNQQGKIDCQRVVSETGRLYDDAKRLDPYRLIGLTDCSVYRRDGYTMLKGDFFSENRYNGWYYHQDDPAYVVKDMEEVHNKMGVVNISEYGAGCNPFCHTTLTDMKKMRADDRYHYEEHANLVHEEHVRQIQRMPYLNFTSLWVLFDFPVAAREEGYMDSYDGIHFNENEQRKYTNDKGLVTRDRQVKKDAFYLYKSLWNRNVTTVYITGRRLTHLQAVDSYQVKVYSNANELSLFIDGQLMQTLHSCPDSSGVIWTFQPVKLSRGKHVIRVVGGGSNDTIEKIVE